MTVAAAQSGTCGREPPFPKEEKREHHERHVHERVAEQDHVQDAARVVAEDVDEILQRRVVFLEAAKLMRLQCEERGLQPGEKRRAEGQRAAEHEQEDETPVCHSGPRQRARETFAGGESHARRFAPHLRQRQSYGQHG